jgi:hypothetical protein
MIAWEINPLWKPAGRFVIDARRRAPSFTIYSFRRHRDDRDLNP